MVRRGNGLDAQDWVRLVDLETPLTEPVLEALAASEIPAFAEPVTGTASIDFSVHLPGGPVDRVWVERSGRKAARAVVDDLVPGLRAEWAQAQREHDDQQWRSIVAGFDAAPTQAATVAPVWPEREDLSVPGETAATGETSGSEASDGRASPAGGERDSDEWDDVRAAPAEADDDRLAADPDDEHFVPPPPPPLPTADAITRAAWIGVIGGPLFLVVSTLLGWTPDGVSGLLAIGAFVGGFVTLVARMKDRPGQDDSGDDGAVV
jgi:hypothetical protein